nr:hypothetical protein [Lachnospiraceae bacterium]
MKKKMILAVLCGMTMCLAACEKKEEKEVDINGGPESVIEFDQTNTAEETPETEETPDAAEEDQAKSPDSADPITKEQALEAIKNYCY